MMDVEDQELAFDNITEDRIKSLFIECLKDTKPSHLPEWFFLDTELDYEAEIFIRILENFATAIPMFEKYNSPKQQKRREAIRSMGLALLKSINQFEQIDSAARGFVFWRATEEMANVTGETNPFNNDMRTSYWIHHHKDDVIKELKAFAKGIQKAADELPEAEEKPIELRTALAIERQFSNYRLKFTTSETGFSAECLRAVLNLGGINKDRVGYWLKEARNHPESMTTLRLKYQ